MKSKSAIVTLSFLFGSTGANRFYLGQNQAGWTTLLLFWVVLPAIIYAVLKFNLFPNHEPFLFARIAVPVLYHIYEMLRYLLMKPEKFKSQDRAIRNTIPLTILSVVLAAILNVAAVKTITAVEQVNIRKVDADVVLSSVQMSAEFRADEAAYRKKYDNKVLQIEGTVLIPPGEDFETQTTYLELAGAEGDAFGIKCFFLKENSQGVSNLKPGDHVVVKGECDGNKLENCLVVKTGI